MKSPKKKLSNSRKSELQELVLSGATDKYTFKLDSNELKVFSYNSSKVIFSGVEAEFLKKCVDARSKHLSTSIDEKELRYIFFKYPINVWKYTSKKDVSTYYQNNYYWVVHNTETNESYFDKEANFLVTLIKLEETSRNKINKNNKSSLLETLQNDKTFFSLTEFLKTQDFDFKSFVDQYPNKTYSTEKVYKELLKQAFPYKIPKHIFNTVFNESFKPLRNKPSDDKIIVSNKLKNFYTLENANTRDYLYKNDDFSKFKIIDNNHWSWLSIIGNGFSFYKTIGKYFFTKSESHYFINPPTELIFTEAIVFAVAYSCSKNYSHSMRICKINNFHEHILKELKKNIYPHEEIKFNSPKLNFIFDCIRFMSLDNTFKDIKKLEEITDYLIYGFYDKQALRNNAQNQPNKEINIFGRKLTLNKIYIDTIAWHHELNRTKLMGSYSWDGLPIDNFEIKRTEFNVLIKYSFTQILNTSQLQSEGTMMRHCVSAYAPRCKNGSIGIFSLTKHTLNHNQKKLLTIEISNDGSIRQVKGLANREPKKDEESLITQFCRHNFLFWDKKY